MIKKFLLSTRRYRDADCVLELEWLAVVPEKRRFGPLLEYQPDVICLQEIRTRAEPVVLEGLLALLEPQCPGQYSGTAMLLREELLSVYCGLTDDFDDAEGRAITAELQGFYLINAYVPNSQQSFYRHAYRREWDAALQAYVHELLYDKPVIICGDFNVARESIDIYPENIRLYWANQAMLQTSALTWKPCWRKV